MKLEVLNEIYNSKKRKCRFIELKQYNKVTQKIISTIEDCIVFEDSDLININIELEKINLHKIKNPLRSKALCSADVIIYKGSKGIKILKIRYPISENSEVIVL